MITGKFTRRARRLLRRRFGRLLGAEEGKYLEGDSRIEFLVGKIQQMRNIYMQLKAEVACIDRRRRRHDRRLDRPPGQYPRPTGSHPHPHVSTGSPPTLVTPLKAEVACIDWRRRRHDRRLDRPPGQYPRPTGSHPPPSRPYWVNPHPHTTTEGRGGLHRLAAARPAPWSVPPPH